MRVVTFETHGPPSNPFVIMETSGREKQPETWQRWITERDGEGRGACVEMYTFDVGEGEEGVMKKVEGQYGASMERPETVEVADDDDDDDGGDTAKVGIEVRVRRGRGADYVQDGKLKGPKDYNRPLLEIFRSLSWKEVQEKNLFV